VVAILIFEDIELDHDCAIYAIPYVYKGVSHMEDLQKNTANR